jgi:hypothetical protein
MKKMLTVPCLKLVRYFIYIFMTSAKLWLVTRYLYAVCYTFIRGPFEKFVVDWQQCAAVMQR